MIEPGVVLTALCLYLGMLFLIALRVEKRSGVGKSPADNPYVYALSLAVYCTAWTYYGSVGLAVSSGLLFLPMYLGPTLAIFLWWVVLRKLVRLKSAHRVTSIADFLSARYDKSQVLAALATFIAIIGIMPYIALQVKAILSTFEVITGAGVSPPGTPDTTASWIGGHLGPIITVLMIFFTIVVGVRKLDPTERHDGMVIAVATESMVKLLAFLAVGIFVTFFLYDGFGDLFSRIAKSPYAGRFADLGLESSYYLRWTTYLVLSFSAIFCLPRQFHVAVVENHDERHIATAMWVFPLYMLLIAFFVVPVALAGLVQGLPPELGDTFVLLLSMGGGRTWLPLLVFIGGFSASIGMVMISSVTIATMITNHLLLPLVEWFPSLRTIRRHLIRCRWAAVAVVILMGYGFEELIVESTMLVSIGLVSFAAVLQFAPALLGGLFWKRANRAGAVMGLGAGFILWCYTLLVPSLVRVGWLPRSIVQQGASGLGALNPEALLFMTGLDPLSHAVIWSLAFNVGFFVLGSLLYEPGEEAKSTAEEFVNVLGPYSPERRMRRGESFIDPSDKVREVRELLEQYFPKHEALTMTERCLIEAGIDFRGKLSIEQLVRLHAEVEKALAGSIGSAAAFKAIRQGTHYSSREAKELGRLYSDILADLKITPEELKERIDYYRERETLLKNQATELAKKVQQLEREMLRRKLAQEALRESEERYRTLVETMNEGVEMEDEAGNITYVNDRLCAMWGAPREAILGLRAVDYLDEEQQKALRPKLDRMGRGEVISFEATWKGAGGKSVSTIVSTAPVFGPSGEYRGSFAVVTDISNLKVLERERANMTSMFAHDMRSSLAGIHGLALRLLNRVGQLTVEQQTEYLHIINRESTKLETLVEDFLEISRYETGRFQLSFQAVSLDRELIELFEVYQAKAPRGIRVELEIEEALPLIEADANRLRRVFTNLLDNAMKFSKEGGLIIVSARETQDGIEIRVADDGIGIDPRELPFIFDIFHRGCGRKKEGYGIGLATVKAIVEGHGGRVEVESEPGRGSTFAVHLPKLQAETNRIEKEESP